MIQNADLLIKEIVLVVLNRDALESVVKNLNFDKVNLLEIVTDGYGKKFFTAGDNKIPVTKFATIHSTMKKYKKIFWLIHGGANADNLLKLKNFLMAGDIPEENIINFEVAPKISATWLANLRHIEQHGADYFVTGNEFIQANLNLNLIPTVTRNGVNLADANQTLRQSCLIAKHVFAHVEPGTIKFVLIGLMPHSLRYDKAANFLYASQNLQYALLFDAPTDYDEFLLNLLSDDVKDSLKKNFTTVTAEPDLNFDGIRLSRRSEVTAKLMTDWRDAAKFFISDVAEDNVQNFSDYAVLEDYINLCLANGAKPVGVIFPFAPVVRKNCDRKVLNAFREMIHQLEENHEFTCVDMFELNISYDCSLERNRTDVYKFFDLLETLEDEITSDGRFLRNELRFFPKIGYAFAERRL